MYQYSLLTELVTGLGYDFKVRWWGQATKASGDVDEISPEQFEQAALISWADFAAKAKQKTTAKRSKGSAVSTVERLDRKAKEQQSQAAWKRPQRIERDRSAYEKIVQQLGIKVDIDTDADDYKDQVRELFYEPLKQQLKYEIHGELISGFASEIKPNGRTAPRNFPYAHL
jgi:hypothetical protein